MYQPLTYDNLSKSLHTFPLGFYHSLLSFKPSGLLWPLQKSSAFFILYPRCSDSNPSNTCNKCHMSRAPMTFSLIRTSSPSSRVFLMISKRESTIWADLVLGRSSCLWMESDSLALVRVMVKAITFPFWALARPNLVLDQSSGCKGFMSITGVPSNASIFSI